MGSKRFIPSIFYIKGLLIRNGNSNCLLKIAANRSLKQTELLSRERIPPRFHIKLPDNIG